MKCDECNKDINEAGVMYDTGLGNKRLVCPRCFITKEKHGTVHVLFTWGLDDEEEAAV